MTDTLYLVLPQAAAGLSVLLMGICGLGLLVRLTRVVRGKEMAAGLWNTGSDERLQGVLLAACAAVISRLAIYLIAYGMHRLMGGLGGFSDSLQPLWVHWDARHYLNIAENGYTAVGDERLQLVFFPLYPLLMRLLSPLTGGDLFRAGMLISLVCSGVSAALLYDLACGLYGTKAAALAVAYFLLSPLSVFLCCVYTEALFICLTLSAIVLYMRGHPWLAAVCGMLSAFTRMPGVIVAGMFIIGAISRFGQGSLRARDAIACIGQVIIVFLGLAAYWLINWWVTGNPMMYLTYQRENWFQEPGAFWQTVDNTTYYFLTTTGESDWLFTWGFQLLCMFYVFALLAAGQRKLPFHLAAYSFVYVAVVLAPTWLLSGPRYLYALAPLPILQSRMHKDGFAHAMALTLSAVLLLIWIFGYAIAIEVL